MAPIAKSVLAYGFAIDDLLEEDLPDGIRKAEDGFRINTGKYDLPVVEFYSCCDQNLSATIIPVRISVTSEEDRERIANLELTPKDMEDFQAVKEFLTKNEIGTVKEGLIHFAFLDCDMCKAFFDCGMYK